MPYTTIRSQFADLLADADEVLTARTRDAHEDEQEALEDGAKALTAYARAHQDDYGSKIYKLARRLKRRIAKLDPEDDDFSEDAAKLRFDLEYLADRCDFELPDIPDAKAPAAAPVPVIRDGVSGKVPVVFDDTVTADKLVEFALATSLYSPLPQSAYHKRKHLTPLLLTALLGRGIGRPTPIPGPNEPPVTEPPKGGTDDDDDHDDDHDDDNDGDDGDDHDDDDHDDDNDGDDHDDNDGDDHDDDDHDDDDDDDDDDTGDDDTGDDDTGDDDTGDDDTGDDDTGDDDTGDDDTGDDGGDDHDDTGDDQNDTGGENDTGGGGADDGSPTHDNDRAAGYGAPAYGAPRPAAYARLSGEERLRRLIERLPGGSAARPDLHGQLLASGARSPEALVALAAKDWPRNINEGVHLRRQLLRILGSEHDAALPPASDLDSLIKAARRDGRVTEQPLA